HVDGRPEFSYACRISKLGSLLTHRRCGYDGQVGTHLLSTSLQEQSAQPLHWGSSCRRCLGDRTPSPCIGEPGTKPPAAPGTGRHGKPGPPAPPTPPEPTPIDVIKARRWVEGGADASIRYEPSLLDRAYELAVTRRLISPRVRPRCARALSM